MNSVQIINIQRLRVGQNLMKHKILTFRPQLYNQQLQAL